MRRHIELIETHMVTRQRRTHIEAIEANHWSLNGRIRDLGSNQISEAIELISGKGEYKTVKESIEGLGAFAGAGLINSFTGDYGLWGTTWGGQGAAGQFFSLYFLLNTVWFNRIQRYTARYLYISNGIANACAYYMAVLALGEGFEYRCRDEGANAVLQQWLEDHNYHEKSKRMFMEYIIQGEEFIRIFGDDFRVIDPDYIYSTNETKAGLSDRYQGILSSSWDNDNIEAFEVHGSPIFGGVGEAEIVPADEMQYRANLMFNERRGRSHFLPVFPQMFKVDQLSTVLLDTAQTQGKFAFYRKWDAPQESVVMMEGTIASTPPGYSQAYATAPYTWQPQEAYPSGAIMDVSKNMELGTIGADNFAQWIEPINLALRMIATQCGLPAEIISQNRGDSDAYASAIVANSWQEKVIKSKQDRWKSWDLDLISRCTGIPKKMIEVIAPPIAQPDKKAESDIINGAIDRHVMSRRTAQIKMGLDPEEEEKQLAKEQAEDQARMEKQAALEARANTSDPNKGAEAAKDNAQADREAA